MRVPIFQVDAFAAKLFAGNPAAVMPMASFPDDARLQAIATENNLSETAFLVKNGDGYKLRWFTPTAEVPLCGHATLASGAVVMERLEKGRGSVVFHSASGPLTVTRSGPGYVMDFPALASQPVHNLQEVSEAIGTTPAEVWAHSSNYMAVLSSAEAVRGLSPDLAAVARLDRSGLVVTAPGDNGYDFVSRYFAPAKGIPEDPVTGSAHCMLTPYWAKRLGKNTLRAFQASPRGGEVLCRLKDDRVELEGRCEFYLEGEAEV
jgi:PhzF family phenazine biosynthesis protein